MNLYNAFISYRNQQFKPLRPDAEIRQMLDTADHQLKAAGALAASIRPTPADTKVRQPLDQLNGQIANIAAQLKDQQEWLRKYFSKGKQGRKSMFYTTTIFGKPIN